jgi:malate synthase
MTTVVTTPGLSIHTAASCSKEFQTNVERVLTPEAIQFLFDLHSRFEERRQTLLASRSQRLLEIQDGKLPDFLPETQEIRSSKWTVAPIPPDLLDRRVEITGPVDRKMIINAQNSGANVFMADFEDSNSPTWQNNIEGQSNLMDAVRRTISFDSPDGKEYRLNEKTAILMVRPRGWHLVEKHVRAGDKPISASLFDFGLYFFHNAKELMQRGTGPYFYLPKLESHLEARLWNDVFVYAQERLGIPRGTIRATVLIETILAAFEMDEILWELREHSAGLNCGRWDYIFSFIKKFSHDPRFVLPDRSQVTMDRHFLRSYVTLLIKTCHRRGIHAMGGMAAQIPIKTDQVANARALEKVRQDKLREVHAGHDGTWVAHPGLVPIASEIFNTEMRGVNQLSIKREDVSVTAADLLKVPEGDITEEGLRWNIDVGLKYLASWLGGMGCVPLYNLMEDAATAEICRAQLWQWVKHGAKLSNGCTITRAMVECVMENQVERSRDLRILRAKDLFEKLTRSSDFPEFLTVAAYEFID